jgi:hypothetical protein
MENRMDGGRRGERRPGRGGAVMASVLAFALAFTAPSDGLAGAMASGDVKAAAGGCGLADGTDPRAQAANDGDSADSWALKWRDGADADPARLPGTVVRLRRPEIRVDIVVPAEGEDPECWLERLAAHPDVEYVHPVGKVKLLAADGETERTAGESRGEPADAAPSGMEPQVAAVSGRDSGPAAADPGEARTDAATSRGDAPVSPGKARAEAAASGGDAPVSPGEARTDAAISRGETRTDAAVSRGETRTDAAASGGDASVSPGKARTDAAISRGETRTDAAASGGDASVSPGKARTEAAGSPEEMRKNATAAPEEARSAVPAAKAAMDLPGKPDDPYLDRQTYLSLIGADRAWALAPGMASDLTIAVVDTGIDLDHPDLKDNLVGGINLVSPGQPPDDDNGHGTRVAGVLAATGNNGTGTAGVLWKAKIMPVKALDSSGYGDEEVLGEAIVKAVDAGAKIIVLSVGLYRYSPYMRDVVRYAEEKDVLLVAAGGNDGVLYGSKAAVKYPAAYPTVLAVAGVAADGSPERRSNAGPEIDIAAAWEVYTTSRGGGYRKEEGTSMAAPQVAAAAALVWSREPKLKAWQVRERLMQTAQDIGAPGRDDRTGAGLLRVDLALQATPTLDAREPNDRRQDAAALPYANQIAGALDGGSDADWFRIDVPHDGWLTLVFEGYPGERQTHPVVSATLHRSDGTRASAEWRKSDARAEWQVRRGTHRLELKFLNERETAVMPYKLETGFRMAADDFEPNDTQAAARQVALADGRLKLTGTFHRQGDLDWFAVTIDQTGDLKLTLTVDTMRIDPALLVKPERGGPEQRIDDYGEGAAERASIPVSPGRYLIRVRDATSASSHPVVGTYTLTLEFERRHEDPNEPNDRIYQATTLTPGAEYRGVFAAEGDEDWFRFRLGGRSVVTITLDGVPSDRRVKMEVYDRRQQLIETLETAAGAGSLRVEREYDEGDHYIRLTADRPFDRRLYRLRVNAEKLTGGFRDVAGHWAEESIVKLSGLGLVSGTGNWRFEPDRSISRAESVALIVRAMAPAGSPDVRIAYRDLGEGHWAYNAIRQATAAGIATGMPDGTFGPSRPVTRAEAAVLIGRALGLQPLDAATPAFADLRRGHWAAPMINRLKEDGLLIGSPGGLVRPDEPISRAEFSVLLLRALEKGRMS